MVLVAVIEVEVDWCSKAAPVADQTDRRSQKTLENGRYSANQWGLGRHRIAVRHFDLLRRCAAVNEAGPNLPGLEEAMLGSAAPHLDAFDRQPEMAVDQAIAHCSAVGAVHLVEIVAGPYRIVAVADIGRSEDCTADQAEHIRERSGQGVVAVHMRRRAAVEQRQGCAKQYEQVQTLASVDSQA